MRSSGWISPARAAKLLGVNIKTMRAWCHCAINGHPRVIRQAKRNPHTGYMLVSLVEILTLKQQIGT